MPAGTIALTNNSTTVTGTGTNFTSELKANDFLVAIVGGVTYTLGVQSVNSATGLTLITAYNGPTATGVAWTAVPNAALVGITAQVAADVAKAIRGLNLDKANWQQVYSASGNITVTLPDGSQYSGPSWNSVANSVSGKMDKSQNLNDVANKSAALSNLGALPTSGGTVTGNITSVNTGFGMRKEAAGWSGNANNMMFAMGSDGVSLTWSDFYLVSGQYWAYRVVMNAGGQGAKVFEFRNDGTFRSSGTVYASGTALTSDARLKSNFEDIEYSLNDIDEIVPQLYDKASPDSPEKTTRELGVVAQKLEKVLPVLVSKYYWNEDYPDLRSVNYSGLSSWLIGYCKLLKDKLAEQCEAIKNQDKIIAELQKRMKAIDGLDA